MWLVIGNTFEIIALLLYYCNKNIDFLHLLFSSFYGQKDRGRKIEACLGIFLMMLGKILFDATYKVISLHQQ